MLFIDKKKHKSCYPIKLEKDKYVFKILKTVSSGKLLSPIRKFPYLIDKKFYVPAFPIVNDYVEIGYHSYTSLFKLLSTYCYTMRFSVYLCKIPKNSNVYYGINKDIVSDCILIKRKLFNVSKSFKKFKLWKCILSQRYRRLVSMRHN